MTLKCSFSWAILRFGCTGASGNELPRRRISSFHLAGVVR
jgi:hypothetical protein